MRNEIQIKSKFLNKKWAQQGDCTQKDRQKRFFVIFGKLKSKNHVRKLKFNGKLNLKFQREKISNCLNPCELILLGAQRKLPNMK